MKNLRTIFGVSALFFAVLLVSCGGGGSNSGGSASEKALQSFYDNLKAKNYDAIVGSVDEEGLKQSPKEDWMTLLKSIEALGAYQSHKAQAAKVSTEEGTEVVAFPVEAKYEKGTLSDTVTFVKRGDAYKLLGYSFEQK